MKRLIQLILCIGLVFGLVGCGEKKLTNKEVTKLFYESMINLLEDVNFTVDGFAKITMGDEQTEITVSFDVVALIDGSDLNNGKMDCNVSAKMFGQVTDMSFYFFDDYLYNDLMGIKTKTLVSEDDNLFLQLANITNIADFGVLLEQLDQAPKLDFIFTETEDAVEIEFDNNSELFDSFLEGFNGASGIFNAIGSDDVRFICTIGKDKQLKNITVLINTMIEEGVISTNTRMEYNFNFTNYGETEVKKPRDLDQYENDNAQDNEIFVAR